MKSTNSFDILEITEKKQFIPKDGFDDQITLLKVKNYSTKQKYNIANERIIDVSFVNTLLPNYSLTMENLQMPNINRYIAIHKQTTIGSFDLLLTSDNQIEIQNLGIMPQFKGLDLEEHLISMAIEKSFEFQPKRMFIQTESLDSNSKLDSYLSRGFIRQASLDLTSSHLIKVHMGIYLSNYMINCN